MRRATLNGWGVTVVALAVTAGAAEKVSAIELAARVDELAKRVEIARNNIDLVERQYTQREEPSDEAGRLHRFSSAEIQYLLGDLTSAAVLFYDLVANKDFQASPRYADALFYLADSLYQQKNDLGARLYLRQLLSLRGAHYKEGLARYLEIAGRLNEFAGIDEYINQARGLAGGQLPPELTYVYAKWLFRRQDLPVAERVGRAQAVFATLTEDETGPFSDQSAFFIGVGYVRLKEWDKAIEAFKKVAARETRNEKVREVQELAQLSMGRVYFELGKYDDAIDHYARVPQQSDNFPDALYEVAWAYVRKDELEKAKNATEVLLMVAEDSVLAPEAKILQGTLLQKLMHYDEAIETYNQVINAYAPVRDEIDALLSANQDPVKYFDELLARNEKTLDVTKLLPPVALKWASTRQEVAAAMEITSALDLGRRGIDESRAIADRILKSLDERGLESFPVLQEGYTRADAVDTSLTQTEEGLTRIEATLAGASLSTEQARVLEGLKAKAAVLKERIDTLPTTTQQINERRERLQTQIDTIDLQAFQLGIDVQSQSAQLIAIRKYVDDTRSQRSDRAEDEKAFLEKVSFEQRGLDGIQASLQELRSRLLDERTNADAAIGGEGILRQEYADLIDQQQQLVASVRGGLGEGAQKVLLRTDVVRADAQAVRDRVGRSKAILRERVAKRAEKLREQVLVEQRLIESYTHETESVTRDTRNLVGRIAFDSFKRVRQSFYDLVLKADVGVVDVSFQRKQDKTSQIQKLAAQKDRELKGLDEEFKEVLKDVD